MPRFYEERAWRILTSVFQICTSSNDMRHSSSHIDVCHIVEQVRKLYRVHYFNAISDVYRDLNLIPHKVYFNKDDCSQVVLDC